jgi:hypothetical protein
MSFVVAIGYEVPRDWVDTCVLRSSFHPVFVSKVGDQHAQDEILRLMGKVAPPWGKYPLMNGVERK